jgi:hypothetical protein
MIDYLIKPCAGVLRRVQFYDREHEGLLDDIVGVFGG